MTNYLRQHIENAIIESKVSCQRLPAEVASDLRKLIYDRFASPGTLPLWERLVSQVSIECDNAWSKIFEFSEGTSVVLFLDDFETSSMWKFQNAADARKVISEAPPLEFYLTNDVASFVLCCNHHDCLVGAGSCQDWLSDLSKKNQ